MIVIKRASTKWLGIKPAPPVTRMLLIKKILNFILLGLYFLLKLLHLYWLDDLSHSKEEFHQFELYIYLLN